MTRTRSLVVELGLLMLVGLGTACGSSGDSDHNGNDVAFAQRMVPHHQQAIEMADLALAQASAFQVKDLATRIKDAQGPEITAMTEWLEAWGEPSDGMPAAGHNGVHGSDGGMMTDAEMQQLADARGPDFDELFLQLMIKHHQGAIEMAGTELDTGKDPEAKALARSIRETQQREIDEMNSLLVESTKG